MSLPFKYDTSFTVMPEHVNYSAKIIFGGAAFSQLDLAAAAAVRRMLYNSEYADGAVTHKASVTFHCAPVLGDIIFIKAVITEAKDRHFVIRVHADVERYGTGKKFSFADAKFVFVAKKGEAFVKHYIYQVHHVGGKDPKSKDFEDYEYEAFLVGEVVP